jgi:hypothetical protein
MEKESSASETTERFETTIGDLIEAITEIAVEAGKSEQEGYKLASATIESILRRKTKNSDDVN